MKRLGIGLLVISGLTACGEKSEENNSNSGAGISAGSGKFPVSALAKPTGLGDMTRADVIMYMESSRSDFLATEVEVAEEAEVPVEGEVDCFGDAFSSIEVAADGDKIVVDVNVDLTECLQKVWSEGAEGFTADVSKALMSLYMEQTCVGADLSSYNGKKLSELEAAPECDNNRILVNTSSEMVATMTSDGQTVEINSNSVNATSTEANEPCLMTRSGEDYAADGCVEIYKSVGPEGSEDNDYSKYTHKTLKWVDSAKNTWYTSGSIDVELNSWAGNVTFRGADINPLYTMEYGTETITGTLTVPSGLYLKSPLQRTLMRGMPRVKKAL